jgi:drug/metabolite transporter (DMT)-like permease
MAVGLVPEVRRGIDGYVFLALMVVIGSSTATAAKFAVRELPVGLLPIVRFGGAGLCLLPLVWRGGGLLRMIREDGGRLLATAAFCVPINQMFFLSATRLAPTTHVGLVYAACPLVVLLLAVSLGQERLVASRLVGILACVLGVVVVGLGNLWQGGTEGANGLRGDLLLVGAVLSWGAYLTVSKPLIARHGALTTLAGTFLVGTLLDLPIALATLPGWTPLSAVSPTAWWSLAYLTLIVTVLGLACQNQALRRFDASQVAAFGNVAPLLTILWGVWLLGEQAHLTLLLGGALTLGGILWASRPAPG